MVTLTGNLKNGNEVTICITDNEVQIGTKNSIGEHIMFLQILEDLASVVDSTDGDNVHAIR